MSKSRTCGPSPTLGPEEYGDGHRDSRRTSCPLPDLYLARRPATRGFRIELLIIVETTADKRILARVAYDPDDFDAAIAELDARYVAEEAAAHAHAWSVIRGVFAALRRRELPSTTTDFVDIDHRKGTAFAPGELMQYLRAGWEVNQEVRPYVEVVHRLNNLGAVITHAAQLTSREGFEAEWRTIDIMTVNGDLINRAELFDESDLDTAIARFDQLSNPAPQLENTASRANARFIACVNARDWDTIASIVADDHYSDDRRRVTGTGILRGRDADIENARVVADLGAKSRSKSSRLAATTSFSLVPACLLTSSTRVRR